MSGVSRPWSAFEDDFLRENWDARSAGDIANALGRTLGSVVGRAYRIKLPRIEAEVIAARVKVGLAGYRERHGMPASPVTHAERCPHCTQRFVKIAAHMRRCKSRQAVVVQGAAS